MSKLVKRCIGACKHPVCGVEKIVAVIRCISFYVCGKFTLTADAFEQNIRLRCLKSLNKEVRDDIRAACAIINDMATFDQAGIDDGYLDEIREGDKFTVEGAK